MLGRKDSQMCTIISKGSKVDGDFFVEGGARIDGEVRGMVEVTGALLIGAGGKIEGDVRAVSAMIGGEVVGNVMAPEKVEMTAEAKVIGDVWTNKIIIDEHAVFQGKCNMNQEIPPKTEKAVPQPDVEKPKKSAKAALAQALMLAKDAQEEDENEDNEEEKKEPED